MKKNKVIAQLIQLSDKEFKLFGKFVSNPVYNKKETVTRVYQFVAKNRPNYDAPGFNKTQCFLHVFPEYKKQKEKLNGKADELINKKLKNPFYYLKGLIEEFIIQQEMAAQSHEKTILLIKGLFKRQMQDKAFQLIDKELKRLKGLANEDFYHHFYQFQLWELKQDYTLDTMKIDENIYTNLINNLDLFYIDTKLRFEYIVKERNIYYGDSYERLLCKDIKCIINNFEIERMTQSTILYSKLFQLPDDFCLKKFDKVKSFYFEHFDKFSFSNKKDFFNHLFNYCIDGYKNGIKFFLKEAFELKKFALKKKINFENGQISTIDFTNFVVISSTLKDYDWALQFIDQYAKYLPEDRKQSIVQISKAQIECDLPNPDFNKVIDLLKDAEYFNTYDNIQARSLMLRAYYQLNEWHTLTYFLDAFHKFLDRNTTIGKEDKVGFKNMIKFTRILIKTQYKKPPKVELLNGLEALKPIRAKQWLTNRINELFDE